MGPSSEKAVTSMKQMRLAAWVALAMILLAPGSKAGASAVAAGGCYASGDMPPIASKTRVYSTAMLEIEGVGPTGGTIS